MYLKKKKKTTTNVIQTFSGISRAKYWRLVRGQEDFDWTCGGCDNIAETEGQVPEDREEDVTIPYEKEEELLDVSITSLAPVDVTVHNYIGSLIEIEDRSVVQYD
jgi:hypothetical protein